MNEPAHETVTVLLFAGAKAAVEGRDAIKVKSVQPSTVGEFMAEIAQQYPALAPLLSHSRLANGDEYVEPTDLVDFSQDIAVIPPVSGG